jgi:hypothetical protein
MEKFFFDLVLLTFADFHRFFGMLVIIFLLLLYMAGRRIDAASYITCFIKSIMYLVKQLGKFCDLAAKLTASGMSKTQARWRPLVLAICQMGYFITAISLILLIVSRCSQAHF